MANGKSHAYITITIGYDKETGKVEKVFHGSPEKSEEIPGEKIDSSVRNAMAKNSAENYSFLYVHNSPGRWCLVGGEWRWCF